MQYFRKIIYVIKHVIITLKFSILSIFISLFILASFALMTISYTNSSNDIIYIEDKSMLDMTKALNQLFLTEINMAQRDAKFSSELIQNNLLHVDRVDEMINYFYILARQFNIVQAIYWGDVNGNYASAEYQDDDSITSYYINRTENIPYELEIKRDVNGDVIKSSKTQVSNYDPRNRIWYTAAVSKKDSVWTSIYLFKPTNYLGVTYAIPVYGDKDKLRGVLGVDIRLDWISWYINSIKINANGTIFVVQPDGKLIAYPQFDKLRNQSELVDIHNLSTKWIPYSFDLFKANKKNTFSYTYNGNVYLASYHPIPLLKKLGWLIGIVVPEKELVEKLNHARNISILISLIVLLLGIFLVSRLVNNIVRPVKSLIRETDKIKNFNLEDNGRVRSRIKEVILLSDAIYTMKVGLRAFQRYVPSKLVRQLIKKGENAILGGTKTTIVALFSDIKDFTTITHDSSPSDLITQLNEYFEALTEIIIQEDGTIDKYIGDSIMAFWGAPDKIEHPCHHAANAALRMINKLETLNKKWEEEGKYPLYTRMGIHIGEAIVGNVGSTERINYTAIGETINIASRLEGANKQYHTSILVSETVYEIIKDQFILNEIGFIKLKGLADPVHVYVLVSRI